MRWVAYLLMAVSATASAGQTTVAPAGNKPESYTPESGVARAMSDLKRAEFMSMAAMPGAPFSARMVTRVKKIAEDGTPQMLVVSDPVARDDMGRSYREYRISAQTNSISPYGASAQAWDPVSQTLIDLSIPQKVAIVVRGGPQYVYTQVPLRRPTPYRREGLYGGTVSIVQEDMGEKTIGTMKLWGTRTTETFAPEVMGSEKPLTKIVERWYSDDLGMDMFLHVVNPVRGETWMEITRPDRHSPDAALFQVPPGFSVRTELKR